MLEDPRGRWNWRTLLVVGSTGGVVLVVGLGYSGFVASLDSIPSYFFGPSPENTLRVLQSVGILLPLLTGLLRFTTHDQLEVSERVNDYLLFGIFGLVLAGVSAVTAGLSTAMPGILKLSLLFVLFTFVVIGLTAGAMFGEYTTETDCNRSATKQTADEIVYVSSEDAGDDADHDTEPESDSESNEAVKKVEDSTEE